MTDFHSVKRFRPVLWIDQISGFSLGGLNILGKYLFFYIILFMILYSYCHFS
uniref:Uncharacterized protein n=1 Tax=Anguilla anguilla TaxID=7936 RepID=A0A0E9PNL8_ANGAN